MAEKKSAQDKIIAFDTLFTTTRIQMMKIMLTYLDVQMQKQLAIYIKFMELQYAISYANQYPYQICGGFNQEVNFDFSSFCQEIMPFLSAKERKQAEQFLNLSRSMEMYQEFSKNFEMIKDIMPNMEGFSDMFAAGSGGMEGLASMFSAGQPGMEGLASMFSAGQPGMEGLANMFTSGSSSAGGFSDMFAASKPSQSETSGEVHEDSTHENAASEGSTSKDATREGSKGEDSNSEGSNDKGSNGEGDTEQNTDTKGKSGDMINTLLQMLTPEQKQMFEMFGGNQ